MSGAEHASWPGRWCTRCVARLPVREPAKQPFLATAR